MCPMKEIEVMIKHEWSQTFSHNTKMNTNMHHKVLHQIVTINLWTDFLF